MWSLWSQILQHPDGQAAGTPYQIFWALLLVLGLQTCHTNWPSSPFQKMKEQRGEKCRHPKPCWKVKRQKEKAMIPNT
ncbi:protein kinase (cAMP-dependent, catalytic) inhibitor beta, transcript variant X2 [Columba livia]|uniref:Protein kinase (cAMP-dependent, catalytic) inhibitor beta, transcript variant X2 n=1 Tax=Columba livia TaxID=8932 RepID=A0A2I0MTY9_COLLI|nr:protein kinase (cAMP-dependent, catalytic) inhibitor beta, transcript variant X2 [Columba livia]